MTTAGTKCPKQVAKSEAKSFYITAKDAKNWQFTFDKKKEGNWHSDTKKTPFPNATPVCDYLRPVYVYVAYI